MHKFTQSSTSSGNLALTINIRSWLLLKDRLSTRNIVGRKNIVLGSYTRVVCSVSIEETSEHLFFRCPFAHNCWNLLNMHVLAQASTLEALEYLQTGLQTPLFMSIIILLCSAVWSERNDLIFRGLQPTLQKCRLTFIKELELILHAAEA
jgi:hypothetical protein